MDRRAGRYIPFKMARKRYEPRLSAEAIPTNGT